LYQRISRQAKCCLESFFQFKNLSIAVTTYWLLIKKPPGGEAALIKYPLPLNLIL
jgi:hypothetical protein